VLEARLSENYTIAMIYRIKDHGAAIIAVRKPPALLVRIYQAMPFPA
jgi:hypothetical protein